MNPNLIESQLDELGASLRTDASQPAPAFLHAVAHRRHARRTKQLAFAGVACLLIAAAFLAGRVSAPPTAPQAASPIARTPLPHSQTLAGLRNFDPSIDSAPFDPAFASTDDDQPLRVIDRADSARARALLSFN